MARQRRGVDVSVFSRGRGAAWGDYYTDGFLDLFVTNGEDNTLFIEGPQFLFHNEGNRKNWLKVRLVGTTSNRQGLGAKVTIQIGQGFNTGKRMGRAGIFSRREPVHFILDWMRLQWLIDLQSNGRLVFSRPGTIFQQIRRLR